MARHVVFSSAAAGEVNEQFSSISISIDLVTAQSFERTYISLQSNRSEPDTLRLSFACQWHDRVNPLVLETTKQEQKE